VSIASLSPGIGSNGGSRIGGGKECAVFDCPIGPSRSAACSCGTVGHSVDASTALCCPRNRRHVSPYVLRASEPLESPRRWPVGILRVRAVPGPRRRIRGKSCSRRSPARRAGAAIPAPRARKGELIEEGTAEVEPDVRENDLVIWQGLKRIALPQLPILQQHEQSVLREQIRNICRRRRHQCERS